MMLFGTPFLVLALSCPDTTIINKSSSPFNDIDRAALKTAASRCVIHYPLSPCLVKFIKIDEQNYYALCGRKR